MALALAAATAAHGTDTVVVDADTYGGSLAQLLSVLDEVSGLVAACRTVNQGRSHQVVEQLLDIDPQLRLLTGLPRADMWTQVRPGALDVVLSQLRLASDLVVVDCGFCLEPGSAPGQGRNQTALQVLDLADAVVVVGKPDPVGLSRLIRGLHDLREVVTTPIIVVNQMRPSLGWGEREVRSTVLRLTGQQPAVFLPLDQPGVDLAVMNGRSAREAVPSSPFVARVEGLTTAVMDAVSPRAVLAAADT
ncbi:CpaE family protein [Aeromicrobium sp. UC242_57]|uniref:CpaE family protein n=1 Tax=Aeromicrobium sp. UC242_57 TaxID=3374624 RepID=UPI0037B502EA